MDASRIDLLIIKGRPGVYGIANTRDSIGYLGRSDFDLNTALKHWIGKYKFFWFEYAISQKDAFIQECTAFHRQIEKRNILENVIHPGPPDKVKLKCPVCGKD
ncbi:MAG: hypothetical protein OEW70_02830 [candidate division WOR-3 bacterium]|nr:hypothetical protein [candidate division WOR-3 bacterium]